MYKRRWHLRSLVARPSRSPLSPYTTLFRSEVAEPPRAEEAEEDPDFPETDRHRGHLVHVDRGIDLQVPVNPDAEQRSEERRVGKECSCRRPVYASIRIGSYCKVT